jgi:hypothetical protein
LLLLGTLFGCRSFSHGHFGAKSETTRVGAQFDEGRRGRDEGEQDSTYPELVREAGDVCKASVISQLDGTSDLSQVQQA